MDAKIRKVLEDSGRQWEIRPGTKHVKLLVEGRMIGVLPHGNKSNWRRGDRNLLARIRRLIREQAPRHV